MDIGVLTVPLGGESIDDAVAYLDDIGVDAVELGVGGWPSEDHVDREAILDDDAAQAELRELLDEHGLRISALATHNNPSTPTRSAPRRPTESSARRSSLPTSWTWARSPVSPAFLPARRATRRRTGSRRRGRANTPTPTSINGTRSRSRTGRIWRNTQTTTGWMSPSRCTRTCSCTSRPACSRSGRPRTSGSAPTSTPRTSTGRGST